MQVGLHVGKFHWPGSPENISDKLAEIAKTADDNDLSTIWIMDHLFQLGTVYGEVHGPVEAHMLEGYTTMGYLAGITKRIQLGLGVTCNFFREPGLLVKMVSTLDVLSKGRAFLGIGAGWFEREAKGLGIAFPSVRDRIGRLEETLQIAKQMWAGDTSPFEGEYYQLAEPINNPQPLSKPHPPILIGAFGDKMLGLVAKHADAWNFVIGSPMSLDEFGAVKDKFTEGLQEIRDRMNALENHCKDIGREFDEIEKTVVTYIKLSPDGMNADEVIGCCRQLADVGMEHVIFNMPNVDEIAPIETLGEEVVPAVADL